MHGGGGAGSHSFLDKSLASNSALNNVSQNNNSTNSFIITSTYRKSPKHLRKGLTPIKMPLDRNRSEDNSFEVDNKVPKGANKVEKEKH